ncbi:kinase-like domain-containing protein, partial [Mycena olivaceomarginata]
VATGLEYLHRKHIVHGDLKGQLQSNILVTPSGRACIADFGLASIADASSFNLTLSSQSNRGGTLRYQAPELFSDQHSNHFGSDVYAFACVGYEILTGKVPFFEISADGAIILKVMQGVRPSRLPIISPVELWLLLDDCWSQDPKGRPAMTAIHQRL